MQRGSVVVQREYLSPNEVAELLGVSPFTIRRYIKLGELKAVKLLGGFRVHREDLQRFLKAHEVNPGDEALSAEEMTTPAPALSTPLAARTADSEAVPESPQKREEKKTRRVAPPRHKRAESKTRRA